MEHGLDQAPGDPIKIQGCLTEAALGSGAPAQAEFSLPAPVGWLAEDGDTKIWLPNKLQGNGAKRRTARAT